MDKIELLLKKIKLLYYTLIFKISFVFFNLFKSIHEKAEVFKFFLKLDSENKNDIYISTYMRSGTTWMQMILYQLTTKGEMNFKHIYEVIPWIEIYINPRKKFEMESPMRIFKTHLDYKFFPGKFNGKFICMTRNGLDVASSQFHQLHDFGNPELTFAESYKYFFINSWFTYVRKWMINRKKHKILYVRYEDIKKDLRKEIYRVADFCNIKIEEAELPRILERSSFDFMKKHEDKFGMEVHKFNTKNFLREGKVNKGKIYFDDKQYKEYTKKFNKYLSKFELLKDYNMSN